MKILFPIIVSLILAAGCKEDIPMSARTDIHPIIKELQAKYAPDKRTAIFSITVRENGSTVVLKGDVGDRAAKDELLRRFGAENKKVIDKNAAFRGIHNAYSIPLNRPKVEKCPVP